MTVALVALPSPYPSAPHQETRLTTKTRRHEEKRKKKGFLRAFFVSSCLRGFRGSVSVSRRPSEIAAPEQVQMQVRDGLPRASRQFSTRR